MNAEDVLMRTEVAVSAMDDEQLDVQRWGKRNIYPQQVHSAIGASPVAASCVERYASFIEGNGFRDEVFAAMVVNRKGHTCDDIASKIASDYAEWGGFALHVNYNALGDITEIQHVPFENCRLGIADENGYINTIAVHPDWTGKKMRGKKRVQVSAKDIDYIFRFNPLRSVVLAQIEACGGVEYYKGQIYWYSNNGDDYPTPRVQRVLKEVSTDEGISNIKWRSVRNNFLPAAIIYHKKGSSAQQFAPLGEERRERKGYEDDSFNANLKKLQGDTNACKIMSVSLESNEDKPELVKLDVENYDKTFSTTEESTTSRIYSAFGQETWYCIRIGKVGFSGDVLTDAFQYYNSMVVREQRVIERAFETLFARWYAPISTTDFGIKPMLYVSTSNENV